MGPPSSSVFFQGHTAPSVYLFFFSHHPGTIASTEVFVLTEGLSGLASDPTLARSFISFAFLESTQFTF